MNNKKKFLSLICALMIMFSYFNIGIGAVEPKAVVVPGINDGTTLDGVYYFKNYKLNNYMQLNDGATSFTQELVDTELFGRDGKTIKNGNLFTWEVDIIK